MERAANLGPTEARQGNLELLQEKRLSKLAGAGVRPLPSTFESQSPKCSLPYPVSFFAPLYLAQVLGQIPLPVRYFPRKNLQRLALVGTEPLPP